jgi:type II secretory pathway component GspD/PulD (secretin)
MLTLALALLALGLPTSNQDPDPAPEPGPEQAFEIVTLEHAVASEAAPILAASASSGVKVLADGRTNSLLVHADPRGMAEIKDLIARIDQPVTQTPDRLFPMPSADMVVAVGEQGDSWSVWDMAMDYGRLTNQHFIIDDETKGYLESNRTGLRRSLVVPKAEVQAVFEHVLEQNDFVMLLLRQENPRLLGIVSLQTGSRNNIRSRSLFVPGAELDKWASHKSILITTVVHLPHTDVRQLSNSMRTMITDANTQQMLPAGNTNSMVLTGFASNVTALVHMLKIVDEATATEIVEPKFERLQLSHAQASVAALIVQELIDASTLRVDPQRGGAPLAPHGHVAARVVADDRTNALLVLAMPSAMVRIHRLVDLVDVEQK